MYNGIVVYILSRFKHRNKIKCMFIYIDAYYHKHLEHGSNKVTETSFERNFVLNNVQFIASFRSFNSAFTIPPNLYACSQSISTLGKRSLCDDIVFTL